MLDAALAGLIAATEWPAIGYLFFGIALGVYFGAVPGLSGLSGMAILLPFTFGMDPVSAFSFLLGMYAVTTTSDSITAILIGVPGTAAAQATNKFPAVVAATVIVHVEPAAHPGSGVMTCCTKLINAAV